MRRVTRAATSVVLLAACGRLGFDARDGGGGSDAWAGSDGGDAGTIVLTGAMVADTSIEETNPDQNNGNAVSLTIDGAPGGEQRMLLRVVLDAVPTAAVVEQAVLELYVLSPSDVLLDIYRLGAEWSESEATWLHRRAGVLWSSAGGDLTTELAVTGLSPGSQSVDIVSFVRPWVADPAANFGVALIVVGDTQAIIASREAGTYPGPLVRVTFR